MFHSFVRLLFKEIQRIVPLDQTKIEILNNKQKSPGHCKSCPLDISYSTDVDCRYLIKDS